MWILCLEFSVEGRVTWSQNFIQWCLGYSCPGVVILLIHSSEVFGHLIHTRRLWGDSKPSQQLCEEKSHPRPALLRNSKYDPPCFVWQITTVGLLMTSCLKKGWASKKNSLVCENFFFFKLCLFLNRPPGRAVSRLWSHFSAQVPVRWLISIGGPLHCVSGLTCLSLAARKSSSKPLYGPIYRPNYRR